MARRLPFTTRGGLPHGLEESVAENPCPRMRTATARLAGRILRLLFLLLLSAGVLLPAWQDAAAQVRIKDIADLEGVRDNQLVGYGLVVGLNGTGDRLRSAPFTRQSLIGVL